MTSATRRVDVLVIGGGPTGLGAATRLQERAADWHLVETADNLGGMAGTVTDDAGFKWDLGGHVLHSHFADFDKAIADSGVRMLAPVRNGWVWMDGELVAAPIQHQVDELPDDLRPDAPAATLDDYYRNHLGSRLHGAFFKPFTEKMWAAPLERIDHTWTSMRNGSAERNVPTIRVKADAPAPSRASFPYPAGGTGALWDAIASRLDPDSLQTRARVCAIDLDTRTAHLADGDVIRFVDCVSSMPLTTLLRSVGRRDWAARSTSLVANATLLVGLGYRGTPPPALADKTWLYCPDKDVAWHRATVLSNYDPAQRGRGPLVGAVRGGAQRVPGRRPGHRRRQLPGGDGQARRQPRRAGQHLGARHPPRLPGAHAGPRRPAARGRRRADPLRGALAGPLRRVALRVVQPGLRVPAGRRGRRGDHDGEPGGRVLAPGAILRATAAISAGGSVRTGRPVASARRCTSQRYSRYSARA